MLNQKPKARRRFNPISSRFGGPILTFASHSGECQIHFPRAYSVLIESERKLQILVSFSYTRTGIHSTRKRSKDGGRDGRAAHRSRQSASYPRAFGPRSIRLNTRNRPFHRPRQT